jgi:hypothetical protein
LSEFTSTAIRGFLVIVRALSNALLVVESQARLAPDAVSRVYNVTFFTTLKTAFAGVAG